MRIIIWETLNNYMGCSNFQHIDGVSMHFHANQIHTCSKTKLNCMGKIMCEHVPFSKYMGCVCGLG